MGKTVTQEMHEVRDGTEKTSIIHEVRNKPSKYINTSKYWTII